MTGARQGASGEGARSRRIAFCADDFGSGAAVDGGILQLVALGRITAVSCQVGGSRWRADAPALLEHRGTADVGLHLDLAGGRAGLLSLLVRTAARAVSRRHLAGLVESQLDAFERAAGGPPDHVDGHQHVHQLPVVRDVLLEVLARRAPGAWVRSTVPLADRGRKARTIAALGGHALRRALRTRGIPHNADFAGVSALDAGAPYPALVRAWLADVADGGLIMCHPGLAPGDAGDPIAPARAAELRHLSGSAFAEDCSAAGVVAVRLPRAPAAQRAGVPLAPAEG